MDNKWDYLTENFTSNSAATAFVKNDKVLFADDGAVNSVVLNQKMVQDSITFNISDKFTLSGVGGISGKGSLVKMGSGELVMNLDNSDYTGATLIKGGTLSINSIGKAGKPSSLGSAATDASLLQILGGRLTINNENVFTDREIHISDSAFLNIPRSDGFLTLGGKISGTDGILIKEGKGQLNFFYNGLNPIKKLILRGGTIGQGEKGATLGTIPVSVEASSRLTSAAKMRTPLSPARLKPRRFTRWAAQCLLSKALRAHRQ